jgi:hypothetical protein
MLQLCEVLMLKDRIDKKQGAYWELAGERL